MLTVLIPVEWTPTVETWPLNSISWRDRSRHNFIIARKLRFETSPSSSSFVTTSYCSGRCFVCLDKVSLFPSTKPPFLISLLVSFNSDGRGWSSGRPTILLSQFDQELRIKLNRRLKLDKRSKSARTKDD